MPYKERGFSTVELLSTLIIAATFVTLFYQLYLTADIVSTRSRQLVATNEVVYRKLQHYENMDFQDITTPNGTSSAEVEDFVDELPSPLPSPTSAKVSTALLTPTLKAVNVKATYGSGNSERVVEYTTYIQESGVGR